MMVKLANLHSRLQETIKKHEVTKEVIQGVNEFVEEMMALQELPDVEVELSENCTANINENNDGKSDEDNYSEENEGVESDDDEISVVDLSQSLIFINIVQTKNIIVSSPILHFHP